MIRDQEVITDIEIEASAERVWEIFTDFASFPRWNPFIKYVIGSAVPGTTVVEFVYIADGIFAPLPMQIVTYDPARELSWRGAVPHAFAAVSVGHHVFGFEPLADDRCRFSHHAVLRGLLMQLGAAHIQSKVRAVHEDMNHALKVRAETLVG